MTALRVIHETQPLYDEETMILAFSCRGKSRATLKNPRSDNQRAFTRDLRRMSLCSTFDLRPTSFRTQQLLILDF